MDLVFFVFSLVVTPFALISDITVVSVTSQRSQLTARSATQLESARDKGPSLADPAVLGDCKSGSCTNLDTEIGVGGYTNMSASNTNRLVET